MVEDTEGFVPVARSVDVDGPPHPRVEVEGHSLLLVRLERGPVVAVGAACPHLGNPLTRATVADDVLECPFHFYAYRLPEGDNCFPGDPEDPDLPVYETREVDGRVLVRVGPGGRGSEVAG